VGGGGGGGARLWTDRGGKEVKDLAGGGSVQKIKESRVARKWP